MVKSPNLEVYSGRPHPIHDRDQQTVPLPIKPNAKPSPVSSVVPFRALEWWEFNVSTFVLSIAVKRAALNLNVGSNIGVPLPSWCQPANFIFENRPNVRSSTRPLCSIQTVGSNSHHIKWSDWNNADDYSLNPHHLHCFNPTVDIIVINAILGYVSNHWGRNSYNSLNTAKWAQ